MNNSDQKRMFDSGSLGDSGGGFEYNKEFKRSSEAGELPSPHNIPGARGINSNQKRRSQFVTGKIQSAILLDFKTSINPSKLLEVEDDEDEEDEKERKSDEKEDEGAFKFSMKTKNRPWRTQHNLTNQDRCDSCTEDEAGDEKGKDGDDDGEDRYTFNGDEVEDIDDQVEQKSSKRQNNGGKKPNARRQLFTQRKMVSQGDIKLVKSNSSHRNDEENSYDEPDDDAGVDDQEDAGGLMSPDTHLDKVEEDVNEEDEDEGEGEYGSSYTESSYYDDEEDDEDEEESEEDWEEGEEEQQDADEREESNPALDEFNNSQGDSQQPNDESDEIDDGVEHDDEEDDENQADHHQDLHPETPHAPQSRRSNPQNSNKAGTSSFRNQLFERAGLEGAKKEGKKRFKMEYGETRNRDGGDQANEFGDESPFSRMIYYCLKGQSYQVIKCCKDIKSIQSDKGKAWGWFKELQKIGNCAYKTKSLIYGMQEIEFFNKRNYSKVLEKRQNDRENYLLKPLVDHRPLFKKYLDPAHQNEFQKRFNAFLLFVLNNSQDELLMAYTDFCKQYFKAGLPSKEYGRLPQKFTHVDFQQLEQQFFKQNEIMSDKQFQYIYERFKKDDPAVDPKKRRWKETNEKDSNGENFKTIKFEHALPYIVLAFYCYITREINKRYNLIAQQEQVTVPQDPSVEHLGENGNGARQSNAKVKSKTSLDACFEKAGLENKDWFKRVVSYSMAENAILFYQQKNVLNIDQVELILRMVRERMGVHQMYRCESKREYFDHALPRKSFGRWLMAELALQKKMKELAQNQQENKTLNRERFRRSLLLEEKFMQIAINMEKLDHLSFIKLVTKNLLIILHARKRFGTILDLDKHKSVKEALMAQLKIEEEKAKDLIMKEYRLQAERQYEVYEVLSKEKAEEQAKQKRGLKRGEIHRKIREWRAKNDKIIQKKQDYEKMTSASRNYKLFKKTMWQTYWHTLFEHKKEVKKQVGKRIVNEGNYDGPTNLHHFTVHEFNEALFFAMREYSSYVNFSQIENATYGFFMDQILSENVIQLKEKYGPRDDPSTLPQKEIYPIHKDQPDKFYWRIFVNDYLSRNTLNEPKTRNRDTQGCYIDKKVYEEDLKTEPKKSMKSVLNLDVSNGNGTKATKLVLDRAGLPIKILDPELPKDERPRVNKYQDTLLQKNVSDHIRQKDKDKIMDLQHTKNSLQTEVEAFRSVKLCDLEFTRFAYQIAMDEAHRQTMQTMTLMYLSSPRCIVSHKPDEAVKNAQNPGKGGNKSQEDYQIYRDRYEKLKRNNFISNKELAQIRETFKEDRAKRINKTRLVQQEKFDRDHQVQLSGGGIGAGAQQLQQQVQYEELDFSDIHYPLNQLGTDRYEKWERERERIKNEIGEKLKGEEHKEERKEKRKMLRSFYYKPDPQENIKPMAASQEEMVNILLTMNYLSGFAKYIQESIKKQEKNNGEQAADQGKDEDGSDSQKSNDDDLETNHKDVKLENADQSSNAGLTVDRQMSGLSGAFSQPPRERINIKIPNNSVDQFEKDLNLYLLDAPQSQQNTPQSRKNKFERPNFKFNKITDKQRPLNDLLEQDEEDDSDEQGDYQYHHKKKRKHGHRSRRREGNFDSGQKLLSGKSRGGREGDGTSNGKLHPKSRQVQMDHQDEPYSSRGSQNQFLKPNSVLSHGFFSSKQSQPRGSPTRRFKGEESLDDIDDEGDYSAEDDDIERQQSKRKKNGTNRSRRGGDKRPPTKQEGEEAPEGQPSKCIQQ